MEKLNELSITGVCASLTNAFNIEPSKFANKSIDIIDEYVKNLAGSVDRVFMYNPDAVAMWLYEKYNDFYKPFEKMDLLKVPLQTVMPSVTPVCFGSMYTGAYPNVHGITTYAKPVITIDTLFDALIRQGKKPAIVSTANDSLSMIFLQRKMDYFIYPSVDECTQKAKELILEDKYDFILLYNADYDATMHRFAPEGKESLEVLKKNIRVFSELYDLIEKNWTKHNTLLGFAPDHGCHEIDGGLGSHGLDMPEDLNIYHFYKVFKRK